ncbi:MtaA/CmuA family methyltransferase [Candidatus Pyrohabitans sp.]
MSPKDRVMDTLEKREVDRLPVFSGMGNVTLAGMQKYGIDFASSHTDARMMATLACSTYELFGFECAVVPFDLCVEAEALGCEVNYYAGKQNILYPTIKTKVLRVGEELSIPENLLERGRIPLVEEAISLCREKLKGEVAVGSYVLGPFTLAGQLIDLNDLLKSSFKKPEQVKALLGQLVEPLAEIANAYHEAGADYITVREMGAPSDVISPRMFKALVQPYLRETVARIKAPTILHMCGDTNMLVEMLHECGASAISVEQKNDVAATREKLGEEAVILGNIDAYGVLVKGTPEEVESAVEAAIDAGVDGVMPGCDIWPEVPEENMYALIKAVEKYGAR